MRIFIAEDDVNLNKALKTSLEKQGYAVDSYVDGTQAERYLQLNHLDYDVIILDWMMPGRSGIDICKDLREQEVVVPILMLTGLSDTDNKVTALDAGADDYITKPFSIDELIARIRAVTRRPKHTNSNIIKHGDITLDSSTRRVYINDEEINVTLKEFGILEYLMLNPNQVIARDTLLDHVWDAGFNSFSNIIDVHIASLRKKLNMKHGKSSIETVRGIGYRLTFRE